MQMNIYLTNIRKMRSFLGPRVWKLFFISLILGIVLFLVESSFIFVLQGFLRTIGFVDQTQIILPQWYPTKLTNAILVLILFGVLRGLIYMIRYYISGAIGQIFATLQRQRVLEYGLRYADKVSSGQIIALFTERVTHAAGVLQGISQLIVILTACLLFFMYGIKKAPYEMMLGVGALAILMIPLKKFNASIIHSGDGLRNEWSKVNATLIQGLRNHFFFKIYNLVELEIQKAHSYLKVYDRHYLRYYKVSAIKNHTPNIIGIFVVSFIAFVSVRYIHTRPVILISFFYIFIRFTQGLSEASTNVSNLKLHWNGFKELYFWHEKLEHAGSVEQDTKPIELLTENPFQDQVEIEIKNLSFAFPDEPILFKNLNLAVKKGEILLIKGPSGVGKSTLLMLILGFLKPTEGHIHFNQYDVERTLSFLSSIVGYVGPEPYLIVGTIRENILFGHQDINTITNEMIIDAMEKAQLDTKKFHLDFFVSEQATLSTGQKQRLSIARAILRKPKLLILDEATANLDGATEQKFTDNIKDILRELTTIVISHKPSFDQIATTILTLEKST